MIKIENVVLPSPAQWMSVIRGARNPMNSWEQSDSYATYLSDSETTITAAHEFFVGEKDEALLKKLSAAGDDHGKFMRMIPVYLDVTAPLYWWKEFDTYKIGTVANSCSTMHKIHEKEFTLDDFSIEHLDDETIQAEYDLDGLGATVCITTSAYSQFVDTVAVLNFYRKKFIDRKEKKWWLQMIQLLPTSYNQRRTVMLNYQVLKSMYHARKNHKLDEWREFCRWIETLPYSEIITGRGVTDGNTGQ